MRRTVSVLPAIILLAAGCVGSAVEDGTTSSPAILATAATMTTTSLPAAALGLDALADFRAGPVPPPATCPPGSTPDVPGDPDAPRPPISDEDRGVAAFDRKNGLLVLRGSNWTWVFDPCHNQWGERAAEGPTIGDRAAESLVYDEDSDLVVAFDGDAVWTYDTEADVWTRLAQTLPSAEGQALYHPPSGLIVLFNEWNDAAWAYDVTAGIRVSLGPGVPQRGLVTYDRAGAHFIMYQVASGDHYAATWEYLPGQGWNRAGGAPGAEFVWGDLYNGEEIAFDEAAGRVALLSHGQLAALNSTSPSWEVLYSVSQAAVPVDGPDFRSGAGLVYDSANGRLIALGGWHGVLGDDGVPATDMWAYDAASREWTLLLAAAAGEPWDVVALGDSFVAGAGAGGPQRGLGGAYARLLGEQLGIETALITFGNYETVADWVRGLAGSAAMQEAITGADVVIVWLGYHNVLWDLWGATCEAVWPEPLRTCLVEATETMPADYDALLGAIAALVSDEAIVMIGNQALGPPEILEFGDQPFWPELKAVAYDVWAEGIAAAAAAHGAILVDSALWLTGPEGNQLLRSEFLASDGIHFTAAGYEALAELFLAADGL